MKFTIRQMLFGMIGFALIAAVAGAGANGSPLAYGIAISIGLFSITILSFVALYWLMWLFSLWLAPDQSNQKNDEEAVA